jgi:hypothetical protein
MTALIRLTAVPILLTGASTFLQDIAQVLEVSGFDTIDLRFHLYTLSGGGTATFTLLTSMENKGDDDDWEEMGSITLPSGGGSAPARKSTTFPTPILATTTAVPVPLLRYIRWKVVLAGGATEATVHIYGLARRKAL